MTTIALADERDRLLEEREEVVDEVADLEASNPDYDDLVQRGQTLDTHLQGVEWALDDWGEDAAVDVEGLRAGAFADVEDRLTEVAQNRDAPVGPGMTRNYLVAKAITEAPYLDGDEDLTRRLAAVASLPVAFVKWAKARIDDEMSVEGNGRQSFGALLAERSETSTSTPE